ncbi:hypothetical protein C1I95_17610 [Micromonospora craterilacus]|uniref:Uncharacterized protein n=1 Tax=Micromonospora craterilacus TaxID=1655439 RepID=A0A2W2EHW9_9ACTN|nr:hypothetical protein [Micromonospora craterilacus]PZG16489.1 hypothetical protein C1I95_17610 [Micromonospora craterilacus]
MSQSTAPAPHHGHIDLAREATAAGLTVTELMPHRCHGGETEYAVQLWAGDGTLWAEGRHEGAEEVRDHIAAYRERLAGQSRLSAQKAIALYLLQHNVPRRMNVEAEWRDASEMMRGWYLAEADKLIAYAVGSPAGPHPWQEFNVHGYTCHHPGCRLVADEHPVRAGATG